MASLSCDTCRHQWEADHSGEPAEASPQQTAKSRSRCVLNLLGGNKQRVRNCFGFLFFRFGIFLDLLFCPFSLLFAAFWSWKLPFQLSLQHFGVGTSHVPLNYLILFVTFWSWKLPFQRYLPHFWVRTFIFDGVCNILLLELFMKHGSLQVGFI